MATEIDRLEIKITADATQADKSLNKLVKSLKKVHKNMGHTTSSAKKMGRSTKEFKKFDGTMRSSAKSAKSLASAIGKFYATYFLVIRGIKQLWKSIESTADYVEAFNYFTVSFGKVASKWDEDWEKYGDENAKNYGNSFVTTLNDTFKKLSGVSFDPKTGLLSTTGLKNLGLNIQEVTQYAAQLGSMMDAVGQSGETTLATTNAFVKLAGDISSLYNIDYSEAGAAIRSVLQGQSRAGYKFGWDTTMASLQATADELDLSKAVSEMSQMEKQQLRILTILKQSRVSWGDQSNTINTLANQIRLFKNSLSEVGKILGQLFVPFLQKVLPVVNGITKAIANLLSEIAVFFGIKIEDTGQGFTEMEDDLDGVEDGFDDATESAKKFKSQLQGFDKLNVLSSSTGANGSLLETLDLTEEILKATAEYEKVWGDAFDKMQNKAEEWAKKFENTFANIKNMFKNLSEGKWFEAGQDFNSIIGGIFTSLAEAINKVNWSLIGENVGKFLNGADLAALAKAGFDVFLAVFKAFAELYIGMLSEAPGATLGITGAIVLSKILPRVLPKGAGAYLVWKVIKSIGELFTGTSLIAEGKTLLSLGLVPGTPMVDSAMLAIRDFFKNVLPNAIFKFLSNVIDYAAIGGVAGSFFPGAGTVAGTILGGIYGALQGIGVDLGKILFNYDDAIYFWEETMGYFKEAFKFESIGDFGSNLVEGIGSFILTAATIITEPIYDFLMYLGAGIGSIFGIDTSGWLEQVFGVDDSDTEPDIPLRNYGLPMAPNSGNMATDAAETSMTLLGAEIKEITKVLKGILDKDTSISSRDVFTAVRSENKAYIDRYGVSALA